jgi:drug/metabolite transporter (DMT)-like permease
VTNTTRRLGPTDLALLGLVTIWGANFTVVKSALAELTPMAFNALRLTGASVLTLLLTYLIERDLSLVPHDWGPVLLLGLAGSGFYQVFFIKGIALTRASHASLILSSTPLFVALLGTVRRSERLNWRNWAGIALGFAGIFLLVTAGSGFGINSSAGTGDLLILAATIAWAVYTLYSRELTVRNSVLKVTAWSLVSSTPLNVLAAIPELRSQDWHAVSAQGWLGLLYSAVLAIGVGYVIWNTGVHRLGSARTSLYSYLTPLVGVMVAWIFLGESMQPLQALGAVGILLGVALGRYQPKQ